MSKDKKDLMRIMASLGISVSQLESLRRHLICQAIFDNLLGHEMMERKKDSKYKYLYGWWDDNNE
jgi:hypothetical protein